MSYSAIDIGSSASDRSYGASAGYTMLDVVNTANHAGVITSISLFIYQAIGGVKVGTFYGSGTSWTLRDYETLSNVDTGARTITTNSSGNPINITVSAGDVIGIYYTVGAMDKAISGGTSKYYSGDAFSGTHTFSSGDEIYSLYCTGFSIPDAPTGVNATDDLSDRVIVTWTKVSGQNVDHYHVYRGSTDLGSAGDVSTYDDTGGTPGTVYSYTVKASNAAGLSAASSANNGLRTSDIELTVADSSSALSSETPDVGEVLNVLNDYHVLSTANITLTDLIKSAIPDDTYHETSSSSPELSQNTLLVVAVGSHVLYTGTITFDAIELILTGEQHVMSSESPTLNELRTLVVNDSSQAMSSETPITSVHIFELVYKTQVVYDDYEYIINDNIISIFKKQRLLEKKVISNTSIYVQKKVEVVRYYI